MTIVEVLVGVFATAGLFALFGAGFGLRAGARAASCSSCAGECAAGSECPVQREEGVS
jgi:hypothetical protein